MQKYVLCRWPLPTERPTYGTQERINVAGLFKHSLTMTLANHTVCIICSLVRRCDACTEVITQGDCETRHPVTGHASGIKKNYFWFTTCLRKPFVFANARTRGPSGMARHRVFFKFPQRDRYQQRSPGIRVWMKRYFLM